jgi:hypothetical protein
MATKGNFSATSASTIIVPANKYRDALLIEKTNATNIALGIGETAVAGEGIQLLAIGSTALIRGAAAAKAIYAIGNGGTGVYQEGDVTLAMGAYIA